MDHNYSETDGDDFEGNFNDEANGSDLWSPNDPAWTVNEDALYDLGEMLPITPPRPLSHFANKTLIFIRIVKRECSKRVPVQRVIVLTKQNLYICGMDGDVKRMVPATSITEIVHGFQGGDRQLLLKQPEQDLVLTFMTDARNPPSATVEEFVRLLQLINIAWKSVTLPVSHLTTKLADRAQLHKIQHHQGPKLRMEHYVETARRQAPPPIASDMLQQHLEEMTTLTDALTQTRQTLYDEKANIRTLRNEIEELKKQLHVWQGKAMVFRLPGAMGLHFAQTNAHAENIIAAAAELEEENEAMRKQIHRYRSMLQETDVGFGGGDLDRLRTQFDALRAKADEIRNARKHTETMATTQRTLALLVTSICDKVTQQRFQMYETFYQERMREKDTALDVMQLKADTLRQDVQQQFVMRMR